jgi:hypothetical protein
LEIDVGCKNRMTQFDIGIISARVSSMGFLDCPTCGNERFDITKRQFWNDLFRLNKGVKVGIYQEFGIGMSFEALPFENIVLYNNIRQNTK